MSCIHFTLQENKPLTHNPELLATQGAAAALAAALESKNISAYQLAEIESLVATVKKALMKKVVE